MTVQFILQLKIRSILFDILEDFPEALVRVLPDSSLCHLRLLFLALSLRSEQIQIVLDLVFLDGS